MEYKKLSEQVLLLSKADKIRLAAELLNNLKEEDGSLGQLLPISNATLAIKGHSLDMQVEGRSIYNHLALFKEHLLKVHAKNLELIHALSDVSGLSKRIKEIKLYAPEIIVEKQRKKIKELKYGLTFPLVNYISQEINIRDRIILTGDQQGNGGSTKTGVQDITYLRNEQFKQNVPVKQLIEEIKGYGLSEADAVRLFVVIAGLPKAGYRGSGGERYGVGIYGYFAFSAVQGGGVECLCFIDGNACLDSGSASSAFPALSN